MSAAAEVGLLESFMPRDRRDAIAEGRALADRTEGAALFADISGFTPLTEALVGAFGAQRGAEELNQNLNRVYEGIVGDLASHHGAVLYFSGDAITCWLDGDDGTRAVQCALDMQQTMRTVGAVETPIGSHTLSIKVAVAVGSARRLVVGDPEDQFLDVLAGRLVEHLAAAEGLADQGEIVVDESVIESLGDRLDCSEHRVDPSVGRRCGVVAGLHTQPMPLEPRVLPSLSLDAVRPWILPAVSERVAVGGALFLAELRTAHPIFVRFAGFDYDDDPDVEAALDEFIRAAQGIMRRYEGTLLGITVGDKGAYLNAVIGALRSHEDDAHRAVAAAVELRDLEVTTAVTGLQIGVSVGQVYSGTYGHPERRTLSVLGDPTNLAARLMSKAEPGEVYVLGEVADAVADRFVWRDLPPLSLKGKSAPVRARIPVVAKARRPQRVQRYPLPMVGRDRELAHALGDIEAMLDGRQRILGVSAEAGMGKSRFVAEIIRLAEAAEATIPFGQAESLGRNTGYVVWREVWRVLFGIDDERPDAEHLRHLERLFSTLDAARSQRLPLVGAVVGLDIPDNEVVAHFDPKLRKTSLENLLADLLVDRLAEEPTMIVLEDLHWVDPLSLDLLQVLVRRTADLPVLFVLAYRREPGSSGAPAELAQLPGFVEIELGELDEDGMRSVVEAKAAQVFGSDVTIADALHELVAARAQGNPFYAEELVNYVRRLDLDPSDGAALNAVRLPDSLQAIVSSRIDGLAEQPRQTIKVASVIGREFPAAMIGVVHQTLGDHDDVLSHLSVARHVDLVVPELDTLDDWLFRHPITREVAYEGIPFSVRGPLHERVGDLMSAAGGATELDLIAHHYWHGENTEKKVRFLRLAGDAARDAYSNAAAIEHYRRLASVVEGGEQAKALLDLAGVLELVGEWEAAEATAQEARALAESLGDRVQVAWCDVQLGEIARKNGRYDDAVRRLGRARTIFTDADDRSGVARALHLLGTVAAQHGELAEARRLYEQSREIREELDDTAGLAALLSNLGVVANYEGDYDAAIAHHQRSLELRREIGDRWAIAVSYTNLGIIAVGQQRFGEAYDLFDEAMRLNADVGDAWMVAIANNNLGNALRGLGELDRARSHYAEALRAYREYDDRWALAFLLEDIAALAAIDSDPVSALQLMGAADTLREAIDAPRPDSQTEELAEWLEPAIGSLSGEEQVRARASGRSLEADDALDRAASYCDAVSGL